MKFTEQEMKEFAALFVADMLSNQAKSVALKMELVGMARAILPPSTSADMGDLLVEVSPHMVRCLQSCSETLKLLVSPPAKEKFEDMIASLRKLKEMRETPD